MRRRSRSTTRCGEVRHAARATHLAFIDPKTKQTPTVNVYNNEGYGALLNNLFNTFDALVKRSAQFVDLHDVHTESLPACSRGPTAGNADAIYAELIVNPAATRAWCRRASWL